MKLNENLILAFGNGSLRIYDTLEKTFLYNQKVLAKDIDSIEMATIEHSGDKLTFIVSADSRGVVHFLNHDTKEEIIEENLHSNGVKGLIFLGDNLFASAGRDNLMQIWRFGCLKSNMEEDL